MEILNFDLKRTLPKECSGCLKVKYDEEGLDWCSDNYGEHNCIFSLQNIAVSDSDSDEE